MLKECLNTFKTSGILEYSLAAKNASERIIDDIAKNPKQKLNKSLYEQYAGNLRKAVNTVYSEDTEDGLSDQFRANVSRFAAYKAFHATQQIKIQLEKSTDDAKKVINAFNRYQAAEYNTAVARCRTAKQFTEFIEPDNLRLFPNMRWLPSRSVTLREEHVVFYNRIWPKNDPFWSYNQPGNLWNCKCDWEETDETTTDGNPNAHIRHNGLEGNPAMTGEIFTDNSSYIARVEEKIINSIAQCYYPDEKSKMLICVIPDFKELVTNIRTGRILTKNNDVKTIEIRPHFKDQTETSTSNPEYKINGFIADAKRIEKYSGITNSFKKALNKQNCKCVVIDFNKHFDIKRPLDIAKIAGRLMWRKTDFQTGKIEECYLVFGEKSIRITTGNLNDKGNLLECLEGLMPQ